MIVFSSNFASDFEQNILKQLNNSLYTISKSAGKSTRNVFYDYRAHIQSAYKKPISQELGSCFKSDNQIDCVKKLRVPPEQYKQFDHAVSDILFEAIQFKSVLDFGSGMGQYLAYFKEKKPTLKAVGLEPSFAYGPLGYYSSSLDSGGPIQVPDNVLENSTLFHNINCALFGQEEVMYDLVMSFEVIEHIPREYHCEVFNFLTSSAKNYILLSVARLGQPGIQHIANRHKHDIISELALRGFVPNNDLSLKLSTSARLSWLRSNLVFYVRANDHQQIDCSTDKPSDWLPYRHYKGRS